MLRLLDHSPFLGGDVRESGLSMNLQEQIAAFATGRTRAELQHALKKTIENYGFSAFCFLDISEAYRRDFSYFGSSGEKWE
jgi:hypothetical protein